MYVHVRVIAGAKKEAVERVSDNHLKISVREKAERNMANARVLELVARECSVPIGKVHIVNGHHSQSKMLSVED